MAAPYPDLGNLQLKNLWRTNNLSFGSFTGMEKLDPKAIGARIRERRKDLGLSQPELAAELKKAGFVRGFSQQNIVSLEKGAIQDPRQKMADMAPILQTTADWLLYERGPKQAGRPAMTTEEYASLPLHVRQEISAFVASRQKLDKSA
jgi:transcriptional regulator with XRE-family HTH domain